MYHGPNIPMKAPLTVEVTEKLEKPQASTISPLANSQAGDAGGVDCDVAGGAGVGGAGVAE